MSKQNERENNPVANRFSSQAATVPLEQDVWQMKTPVCLIIFNRPDTTERVFETIRQAKPPKLFIVADGSRENKLGEADKCAAVRAIVERVDWECEVFRNYSDVNLGCRKRVSSGLDWVFSLVEEAIILEDDCVPHPTFFRFCEELLARYRHEGQVMVISGNNFQFGRESTECSYYFSRYNHIWGWATWRRAWQRYDDSMRHWIEVRDSNWLQEWLESSRSVKFWSDMFQRNYEGFDSWGYAWTFACWYSRGLSVLPSVNLVSNIGFGAEATHTKDNGIVANIPTEQMDFPLKHPPSILRHFQADTFTEEILYSGVVQFPRKDDSVDSVPFLSANGAVQQLQASILENPHNAEAYIQLGQLFKDRQKPDASRRAMEHGWRLQWGDRDYVSPGLALVNADPYFPHLAIGDRTPIAWQYLRKEIPHNWYVDRRSPNVGFLSRDEAHLLYNLALQFQGQPALEVGCWMGWSACHLALAGVQLDVIDPLLERSEIYQTVSDSLTAAGVRDRVCLVPGYSPQAVQELAARKQQPWSLIFIDGNHECPAPLQDAKVCAQFAAADAAIVFHDLVSPDVAEGLAYLHQSGWKTLIYQTMQIMGIAWRGNIKPIHHNPDPRVEWTVPQHLKSYPVSGMVNFPFQEFVQSLIVGRKVEASGNPAFTTQSQFRKPDFLFPEDVKPN